MGKGTLITSPTIIVENFQEDLDLAGTYVGHVYVGCNDDDDPDQASPFPLVVDSVPAGIKNGDFVEFRHVPLPAPRRDRNRRVVEVLRKASPDDCGRDQLILKVTLSKEDNKDQVAKKSATTKKKAKKAVKKKK
jgi:hypothetical protein